MFYSGDTLEDAVAEIARALNERHAQDPAACPMSASVEGGRDHPAVAGGRGHQR